MNKTLQFSLAALVGFSATLAIAPDAHAATTATRALDVAKSKTGAPYKYGAAGPSRFDCSGLTMWSFGKVGKKIPRTAQAQYNASSKVSPSHRKVGDLIFIGNSSRSIYHAGIYAGFWKGHGWMLDAPKPGRTVGLHQISGYTKGAPRAYYGSIANR